jgi:hypothetical protein
MAEPNTSVQGQSDSDVELVRISAELLYDVLGKRPRPVVLMGFSRSEDGSIDITLQNPDIAAFMGDPVHPGWSDYVATNLLDALQQVPDTGDWHGALRAWCERHKSGNLKANRTGA